MDGEVVIGTKLDTKSFDNQIKAVERDLTFLQKKEAELISLNEAFANSKGKALVVSTKEYQVMQKLGLSMEDIGNKKSFIKLQEQIEKATNKLITLKKKQDEINNEGTTKFQKSLTSIGEGVDKITHKVGKWALAIIGVRSIYMGIRNAINILSQQDQQLANDITYIRTALAYTLEPIVRAIVDLMKQLMYYVGYIVKAWTGRDIFAKANKGLKNATSNAKELNKELNKTIASFDEMEILQNTSSAGTSGGVGTTIPSFDSTLDDIQIPKWLDWIVKNKGTILKVLGSLAATILAVKGGLKGIKAIGIGIAVYGIFTTIQAIVDYINEPSFKNFIKILEGIAITVGGIAIAFGAWHVALGAAIGLIVIEIVKNFDKIKDLFNRLINWLDINVGEKLHDLFGPIGDWLYLPIKIAVDSIQTLFENLFGGIKKIFEGIVLITKGDFVGGLKTIFGGLTDILLAPFRTMKKIVSDIFTTVLNTFIDIINGLIDAVNVLPFVNIGHIGRIGEKNKGAISGGRAKGGIFYPSLLPKLAVGGIINNPGPGVPYHGASIGERGAEAVVPLTDSQQMELLGETIGRYITVNATIPVYAYNRQVDKQIRTIRAEDDFAYNR